MDALTTMIALMKRESNSLGFIPKSSLQRYWLRRDLWVPIHVSGVGLRGYLLHGPPRPARPLRIHQAVVDADHRLRYHATRAVRRLVDLANREGASALQLRCRDDLAACRFWEAVGFELLAEEPGGTARGRTIRIYRFPLQRAAQAITPSAIASVPWWVSPAD